MKSPGTFQHSGRGMEQDHLEQIQYIFSKKIYVVKGASHGDEQVIL